MEGRQADIKETKDAPQKTNLLHGGKFHTFLSSTMQWTASQHSKHSSQVEFYYYYYYYYYYCK
jgi:hypothetical protein